MRSKKQKIAVLLGMFCAFSIGAIAYVLVTATFSGEHTGKATTSTELKEPLTISFGETLLPGSVEPVTVSVEPHEKVWLLKGAKVTSEISSNNEAVCKAAWFVLKAKAGTIASWLTKGGTPEEGYSEIALEANKIKNIEGWELEEKNESVEQKCEASQLTIKMTISGPVKYN